MLAKARAAAMVSVKLISAMPVAAGQSSSTSCRSGSVSAGNPVGTVPTAAIPKRSRPNKPMPAIPTPTAISGAGTRGAKLFRSTSNATMPAPKATVGSEACGMLSTVASRLWRNEPL
ncbi:hypothetical protein D3C84_1043800 [compost metagenome]